MPPTPGRSGLLGAKCGRLTGGGVLDEEADHVAEWGAPLGDTGEPPQGALLHRLGTGETVERQVVLLLEELLGPRGEACRRREALRSPGRKPAPRTALPGVEGNPVQPGWAGSSHLSSPQSVMFQLGSTVKQRCLVKGDH